MKLLFFAQLKTFTGCDEIEVPVSEPLHADQLWQVLDFKFPGISAYRPSTRLAINCVYSDAYSCFHDGDEVALIPPVSGG